jgi:hypothetical protein
MSFKSLQPSSLAPASPGALASEQPLADATPLLICTPDGVAQAPGRVDKRCSRCLELRPLNAFTREARKRDGLSAWCKPCKSDAQVERKNAVLLSDPDWVLRRKTFARLSRLIEKGAMEKPRACPVCQLKVPSRELYAHFPVADDPFSVVYRCRACSLQESGKSQRVACRWCKEPFVVQTTAVRRGGGRYCSVRCRNAWMRGTAEHVHGVAASERTPAEQVYLDDRL